MVNEVEFFTALDDYNRLVKEDGERLSGSSHMGTLEYNAATYYRYISLDLGQLWDNLGGEDIVAAVEAFTKALYLAVPAARQSTQSGACPWDYARILVRRGQRMQLSFEKPVRSAAGGGWLAPSMEALDDGLARQEELAGSLYGKLAEVTYGAGAGSIDTVCTVLRDTVAGLVESAS